MMMLASRKKRGRSFVASMPGPLQTRIFFFPFVVVLWRGCLCGLRQLQQLGGSSANPLTLEAGKIGLFQRLPHDGADLFVLLGRYGSKLAVLVLGQTDLDLSGVAGHGLFLFVGA